MNIIEKMVENIINENMMEYSSYVIKQRALPDLRDGMKPVYRRILWTMKKMDATKFTKSQNVAGNVMRFHPHGDTYPTIVGLTQKDNNLTPLIVGKGSFGQRTSSDLQPAAARYTEVKLSDIANEILKDTNKHIVDFVPNFDGSETMPEVLAVKFPMILHMAQSGIAVGMSCNIPSFNLVELNEAVVDYIKTGNKKVLIPDFPTGGQIVANEEMFKKINDTGKGTIRIRAKANIENNVISITEIPYTTTREKIIDKVIELKTSRRLSDITDIKDLTGLDGMKIEISCRKNADANMILEKLYQLTPLESSFSANINVLHNELPKEMGVWEIINNWLSWRQECIKLKIQYEIKELTEKLHILFGLKNVLPNIDEAIQIIRFTNSNILIETLCNKFDIDVDQAEYVANMKLKNINKDYIVEQIKEIDELNNLICSKKEILSSNQMILNMICDELLTINSKYGDVRKSEIIEFSEQIIKNIDKARNDVPDYAVKVIVTKEGYLKKMKANVTAQQKIKDGDEISHEFITNNKANLIIFAGTDAHIIKLHTIAETKSSQLGEYLPTMLNVQSILGATICDDKHKFLITLYDNHRLSKIDLQSFVTSRKKLSNSIYTGGKVIKMITLEQDEDMLFVTKTGKTKKFNTKDYNTKSKRDTQGNLIGKTIIDIIKL